LKNKKVTATYNFDVGLEAVYFGGSIRDPKVMAILNFGFGSFL
jgi:hypothetical protein